jgi:nitrate reductase (NAD(P)H)
MDATDEFNSIHSSKAKAMLKEYYIGELVTPEQKAAAAAANGKVAAPAISITADSSRAVAANGVNGAAANGVNGAAATNGVNSAVTNGVNGAAAANGDLIALDPRKKIAFKLAERIELSHNVRLFRFALQSPQHKVCVSGAACWAGADGSAGWCGVCCAHMQSPACAPHSPSRPVC